VSDAASDDAIINTADPNCPACDGTGTATMQWDDDEGHVIDWDWCTCACVERAAKETS